MRCFAHSVLSSSSGRGRFDFILVAGISILFGLCQSFLAVDGAYYMTSTQPGSGSYYNRYPQSSAGDPPFYNKGTPAYVSVVGPGRDGKSYYGSYGTGGGGQLYGYGQGGGAYGSGYGSYQWNRDPWNRYDRDRDRWPPTRHGPASMQRPVAFSVARANLRSISRAPSQISFEKVFVDSARAWDMRMGSFMTPEDGLYFFNFNALSPGKGHFRLSLMANGREVLSAWADRDGFQMASNSAILELRRGDRVYLMLMEGTIEEATGNDRVYTTFSGFKLPMSDFGGGTYSGGGYGQGGQTRPPYGG